ncbi:unnamed protein product, partial [marine sediment metagenome]
YGLKVASPDWVNFGFMNDTEGCCGLDHFGNQHFTFQKATKILKTKNKVRLSDISSYNLFGKKYYNKLKKIWNGDGFHYNLADIEGIHKVGIDEDDNAIYGKRKKLEEILA